MTQRPDSGRPSRGKTDLHDVPGPPFSAFLFTLSGMCGSVTASALSRYLPISIGAGYPPFSAHSALLLNLLLLNLLASVFFVAGLGTTIKYIGWPLGVGLKKRISILGVVVGTLVAPILGPTATSAVNVLIPVTVLPALLGLSSPWLAVPRLSRLRSQAGTKSPEHHKSVRPLVIASMGLGFGVLALLLSTLGMETPLWNSRSNISVLSILTIGCLCLSLVAMAKLHLSAARPVLYQLSFAVAFAGLAFSLLFGLFLSLGFWAD